MAKTHKRSFGLSNRVHHMLYWTLEHPVRAFFLLAEHNICYVLLQRSSTALATQRSWFWFSGKMWNDKTYTLNALQGFFSTAEVTRTVPQTTFSCGLSCAVCCYYPELNYILVSNRSGSTPKAFKLLWIKPAKCMKMLNIYINTYTMSSGCWPFWHLHWAMSLKKKMKKKTISWHIKCWKDFCFL